MNGDRKSRRFLGITVLADFILNEGIENILRNVIHKAGATAIACNPTVTAPAPDGAGLSSITESQARIATQIGHIEGAGTPVGNITRLEGFGVEGEWNERGTIDDVQRATAEGDIPVVCLRTGELPYWDCDAPHAVVVIGIEADTVYVNDPAFERAPIPILVGDFQLAWDEFGGQWAAIRRLP